jgi:NADH-quinone oxidoreductase subunit M
MILAALILIPLLGALLVAMSPSGSSRAIAMMTTLVALAVSVVAAVKFDYSQAQAMQFLAAVPWFDQFGIAFSVGVDSIAGILILLTALLGPICVACSASAITERQKTYYAWLLVLQAAMTGVFASRDLILFYVCFEFTLIPMFILISLWGSTNRKRAAIKFFLYTFTGSVIALAGLVYVAWHHAEMSGGWSFDILTLRDSADDMSPTAQGWVLLALMAGFAVKVPLFPVHTWLPLAHTEAPTAGSVILAGVLLKLGCYAILRFVFAFAPAAVVEYAPLLATLSIVGIIYGGLICWVQTDVKKLVAYSSVAHLGFCMLGMFALNSDGLTGSVLYMINHGLSTGALFLLIGMIYERYHTRSMKELGGLASRMPVWSTFMVFFVMASVGLPGLNGFISEFLCMKGAFQASSAWGSGVWNSAGAPLPGATAGNLGPWYALVAGTGVIIAAMYLLIMTGKVVWGVLLEPEGHGAGHDHIGSHHGAHSGETKEEVRARGSHVRDIPREGLPTDLNTREVFTLVPLAALCVLLGVYPGPVIRVLEAPVGEVVKVVSDARASVIVPSVRHIPSAGDHESPSHGVEAHP